MQRTTFSPKCCYPQCQPLYFILKFGFCRLTYSDLKDELVVAILGLQGVENRGKLVGVEFDCREPLATCLYTETPSIEIH